MRRSIATVSLSGTLDEKLRSIAAAHFDGVEIFENDLVNFNASPREVRHLATDLGLRIDLFQPFRDFESVPDEIFARNLDRAERKFDIMAELGAPMMLVCSNVQPYALNDPHRAAAQLNALAERAAGRHLTIAYEALAWGTQVRTYGQAWQIVKQAVHSHLGLTLDSFHTLALNDDPAAISDIPGNRIFFVQLADAPRLAMDPLSWSRHFRCFPGQGQLDVVGFLTQVLRAGYDGPLSLEIFNDVFRASDTRTTALDAMRSLLYLEQQVGALTPALSQREREQRRIELFNPPPAPVFQGVSFLEFAVDAETHVALGAFLERLGFFRAGRHRSKQVTLYRQGEINLILNAEPDSFAENYLLLHGPSLCAIALKTADATLALAHATALLATHFEGRVGPNELTIPAVRSVDGSLLYFVGEGVQPGGPFDIDFSLSPPTASSPTGSLLRRVDHLALALPVEAIDSWILFYRSVLGLDPHAATEMAEPYGLMRSRAVVNDDRSVRITLNASEGRNTMMARSLATFSGPGVHHVALACDDIFETVRQLKVAGVSLLAAPSNYYDDLEVRFGLAEEFVTRLRADGILYDRSPSGEFFHVPTQAFAGRFSFEIVQRGQGYDAHGEANAPAFLAAQEREYASA